MGSNSAPLIPKPVGVNTQSNIATVFVDGESVPIPLNEHQMELIQLYAKTPKSPPTKTGPGRPASQRLSIAGSSSNKKSRQNKTTSVQEKERQNLKREQVTFQQI